MYCARHVLRLVICTHVVHKYDNFVVGLTNVSPNTSTPTFYHYTLCGQYPGAVPNGTTVSLYCQDNLPQFRYVIVQIPLYDHLVACEVEVLVRGMRMSNINILIFTIQAVNCSMLLFLLYAEGHLSGVPKTKAEVSASGKSCACHMLKKWSRLYVLQSTSIAT